MTYAQYVALVEGHNNMHAGKRRRGRVEQASHGDIAALKHMRIASG